MPSTVIPLYEAQKAIRILAQAFEAPNPARVAAVEAAVATLIEARSVLPHRLTRLIDAVFASARPAGEPGVVQQILDELAAALHAGPPPADTSAPLPARGCDGEDRRQGAAQLRLF